MALPDLKAILEILEHSKTNQILQNIPIKSYPIPYRYRVTDKTQTQTESHKLVEQHSMGRIERTMVSVHWPHGFQTSKQSRCWSKRGRRVSGSPFEAHKQNKNPTALQRNRKGQVLCIYGGSERHNRNLTSHGLITNVPYEYSNNVTGTTILVFDLFTFLIGFIGFHSFGSFHNARVSHSFCPFKGIIKYRT